MKSVPKKSFLIFYAVHGNSTYETKFLSADMMTLAVEDEMKLPANVKLTIGISYDAQNFTEYKDRDSDTVYESVYRAKDDSIIWGTRDSFNPVVGIVIPVAGGHIQSQGFEESVNIEYPVDQWDKTGLYAGRLFHNQGCDERNDPGMGKGTCCQENPGQCPSSRPHRYKIFRGPYE